MTDTSRADGSEPNMSATGPAPLEIRTERLLLRQWRPTDREPFAELNADPEVMEHLTGGRPMTAEQSDSMADRFEERWAENGFGLYAVERLDSGVFIGFLGLNIHRAMPEEVEIGWRLARPHWGGGLATEGAVAVRDMAFGTMRLPSLVSITVEGNARSQRVMTKLGFTLWRTPEFEDQTLWVFRMENGSTSASRHSDGNRP